MQSEKKLVENVLVAVRRVNVTAKKKKQSSNNKTMLYVCNSFQRIKCLLTTVYSKSLSTEHIIDQ